MRVTIEEMKGYLSESKDDALPAVLHVGDLRKLLAVVEAAAEAEGYQGHRLFEEKMRALGKALEALDA